MKIFVGYDPSDDIAYQVCEYSIHKHNPDVTIVPLVQKDLISKQSYNRPVDQLASTEFTFTRYLVPHLMGYNGWALFIDCDTLLLTDISELFSAADNKYALMCVQHKEYVVKTTYKKNEKIQTNYPRKNWSSVVLWNCNHPSNKIVSPTYINKQSAQHLHRFEWLRDEEIGNLSVEWNWLVGYYNGMHGTPKLLHYTDGGPWHKHYRRCEYSDIWKEYLMEMLL